MGESDPRRSSRARTNNQSQSQSSSSTSSSSSGRAERSSRSSAQRTSSSQLTTPTASTPSEPPDDSITIGGETVVRALRSRAKDSDRDQPAPDEDQADMTSSDNDIQEDDESVRCICGFDDYPGPPPPKEDTKHGVKDTIDLDPFLAAGVADDVAGFFLQCDICKVWQHGGCVGILSEGSSPEEYFCEQCRKDFHKIFVASNGQKYSHYVPINRNSRSTSRQTASVTKDGTKSPRGKDAKPSNPAPANNTQTSKRRSTMNSRVVYDEEEELRRAIEASKEDAPQDVQDSATKRAKRGRSDSDEKPDSAKRQRTSSRSPSPPDENAIQDDSDDVPLRNGASKKSRAAVVRNQREKAEKEERDRQRAEAANKRKGRADRRRAEDSDPSEEAPPAQRTTPRAPAPATPPPAPTSTPQPPPRNMSPPQPPAEKSHASKSKKSSSRKKGRNQYTKDRDRSQDRSQSREVPDRGGGGGGGGGGGSSRSRNRNSHANKQHEKDRELNWDDMNRWVAFCTDFTQKVEQEFHTDKSEGQDKDKDKDEQGKAIENEKDGEANTNGSTSAASATKNNANPASFGAAGAASTSASSSLLAPPTSGTAPVNGGSPLKNCIDIPPPPPPGPSEATSKGHKSEDELSLTERLEYIKNKIKFWNTTYGPEGRPASSSS